MPLLPRGNGIDRSSLHLENKLFLSLVMPLALLATLASSAPAQSGASAKPWEESAGLQATCADTIDASARIYDSPDYQQQMLIPGQGEDAYLLSLKPRTVQALPKTALHWNEDDALLPDLSTASDAGSFERLGEIISFTADGRNWTIQPEPPLVGSMTLEKLLAAKPDYERAAERYTPDPASVKALKGVTTDTKIVVFFGTWCTYCKHWLPRFIKTLEVVKNPKITAEFAGMSEDQTEPRALISKYNVTQTPSFIVLQGGKEIGRIEERPEESMEGDLARILTAR